MKAFFKRVFCSHIMKMGEKELLGAEYQDIEGYMPGDGFKAMAGGRKAQAYYKVYAIHYKCIKCTKKKIQMKRYKATPPGKKKEKV